MSDADAPRVSVVVPAYNAARTLARTIESVATQVPPPLEIIVVDDGSTDDTLAVARALAGVRVIEQANGGPSAARNAGLFTASGDWVAFADADDVWLPGKLALQERCVRRIPEAVLVAGDWVRTAISSCPGRARVRLYGYPDLLTMNRFQTSTVLVRRDVATALTGFDTALDGAEDWDMWLRCSRVGPIAKLEAPVVVYRDEPSGYSKDLRRVYTTMLTMLDRERSSSLIAPRQERTIRAWHHLRFAVGFVLAGDRSAATAALADLARAGVLPAAPAAMLRYLLPFLAGRVRRRLHTARRPA